MNVTNVTDDMTPTYCTNIDIIIRTILFTIPCELSFLCLISIMVYTLFEPLFNK